MFVVVNCLFFVRPRCCAAVWSWTARKERARGLTLPSLSTRLCRECPHRTYSFVNLSCHYPPLVLTFFYLNLALYLHLFLFSSSSLCVYVVVFVSASALRAPKASWPRARAPRKALVHPFTLSNNNSSSSGSNSSDSVAAASSKFDSVFGSGSGHALFGDSASTRRTLLPTHVEQG